MKTCEHSFTKFISASLRSFRRKKCNRKQTKIAFKKTFIATLEKRLSEKNNESRETFMKAF